MAGIRFLERLRYHAQHPDLRLAPSAEEILRSIIDYVSKILNTRKGSTVIDEDFGIPDFTSAGTSFSKEDMPLVEEEIAKFVERYEPRLKNVKVNFTPDKDSPLLMVFSLNAELSIGTDDHVAVHFVTRVDPLGKVTVS
ncbi:MAG: type VI secretion system baseplate subunit TssE [Desulfovibrionaceae bacterium]|nr:type VI secretion system baseplate subunit TssE [Desulfovibrionaceae bacterium]